LRDRPVAGASAALGLIAVAISIRLALGDLLPGLYYLTIFPAVALSAFIGGALAGSAAILLGGMAAWWFLIPPQASFKFLSVSDAISLLLFVCVAGLEVLLISWLIHTAMQNAQLVHDREVLLREVHHRVKNNLQMVASLVRIASRQCHPDTRPPIEDIAKRVVAIGRAYDHISLEDRPGVVNLANYVRDICGATGAAFGRDDIELSMELDPVVSSIDAALPVGLIANELLMNAYKHGFQERGRGEVAVRLKAQDGLGVLTVRDDGAGLARIDRDGSMGLKLVGALAGQLGGEIKIEGHGEGGTLARLQFPITAKAPRTPQSASA
jgi:two-component sensor histidine kinase